MNIRRNYSDPKEEYTQSRGHYGYYSIWIVLHYKINKMTGGNKQSSIITLDMNSSIIIN